MLLPRRATYFSRHPASADESTGAWKRKRAEALLSVDRCLATLRSAEHCSDAYTSTHGDSTAHEKSTSTSSQGERTVSAEDLMHLVCVDDNMYYRSMRYEYCKLARDRVVGFAQVLY